MSVQVLMAIMDPERLAQLSSEEIDVISEELAEEIRRDPVLKARLITAVETRAAEIVASKVGSAKS